MSLCFSFLKNAKESKTQPSRGLLQVKYLKSKFCSRSLLLLNRRPLCVIDTFIIRNHSCVNNSVVSALLLPFTLLIYIVIKGKAGGSFAYRMECTGKQVHGENFWECKAFYLFLNYTWTDCPYTILICPSCKSQIACSPFYRNRCL